MLRKTLPSTKAGELSLQGLRDLHPCDFVLLKPDSRLRKPRYRAVMFYLGQFPKRREAVIIALASNG